MKIDRNSLTEAIKEIVNFQRNGKEFTCINPILVYNVSNGEFNIQSELIELDETEWSISEQLDTSNILDFGGLEIYEVSSFVFQLSDEYIEERIIGYLPAHLHSYCYD